MDKLPLVQEVFVVRFPVSVMSLLSLFCGGGGGGGGGKAILRCFHFLEGESERASVIFDRYSGCASSK